MNPRRIATVVRIRELQERLARGEVARQRSVLDKRKHSRDQAWAVLHQQGIGNGNAPAFVAQRGMLTAGVGEVEHESSRVRLAVVDVEEAMDAWRSEAQRLDGMERLAERIDSETKAELQRREIVETDDLVVSRWGRNGDAP